MRLRLLRGRSWWLGTSRARGSHRKTRRVRLDIAASIGRDQPPAAGLGAPQAQDQTRRRRRDPPGQPTRSGSPGRSSPAEPAPWHRQERREARPELRSGRPQMRAQLPVSSASTSGRVAAVRPAVGTKERPWYAVARPGPAAQAAGRRNCGCLEKVLIREWADDEDPPAQIAAAIDRLADLPLLIKEKLAVGLDAIHVGPGGVPDLDDMASSLACRFRPGVRPGTRARAPTVTGRSSWAPDRRLVPT